jgi:probable F420-dependent oxidoreductase
MKIGVIYPQNELRGDPEAVRKFGLAAEELGYEHLLAYDHVLGATHDREPKLTGPYTEQHPFHDPFVMFAYLAAMTRRLQFVTGILILPQRQTALVARQAADLDLLSGERFRLGVGIGWNYVEYTALGQDFRTRGKRLAEQVELVRRLWEEPLVDFKGEFDQVDRAALNPRPRRRIPVWFGGAAEPALRRAAVLGDGFIFSGNGLQHVARMKEFVQEAGRPLGTFGLQNNIFRAKTPQDVIDAIQRWRDVGGTHAAVLTMGLNFTSTEQHIDHMKAVADLLRKSDLSFPG